MGILVWVNLSYFYEFPLEIFHFVEVSGDSGLCNELYYTYIISNMSSVYDKAIKLLKIRAHHSSELARKLSMRGFDRAEIDSVIQKLQQEKLIDNEQFAQYYLDELIRNKTFGYYGLKAKLMSRGITSSEAEYLLSANFPPETEFELARKVAERASGLDKTKLAQRLQRKGFRTDIIRRIINS